MACQKLLPCCVPISKRLMLILFGTHIIAGYLFLSPSYIRPDSIAVMSWLRSVVVDGDFLFFNEWAGFGMLGDGFAYFKEVTPVSALANHWWIGTSMVTAPFYLVSHVVSVLLNGDLFPADGFFGLDLATAGWTSVFFHALTMTFALLAVRRIREPQARDRGFIMAALVCTSLGTPAFWYAFRMPIGTHAAGMMLVGLLTYLCIRVEQEIDSRETAWNSPLLLGLILGLAIATRIQHVVLVPAVLYALLATRRPLRDFAVVAVGAALPLLVQGAAWFVVYGNPLGPIAAGAHLDGVTWTPFRRLAFLPVLLSSWRGLFVWSPVWAPAILGWILLARRFSVRTPPARRRHLPAHVCRRTLCQRDARPLLVGRHVVRPSPVRRPDRACGHRALGISGALSPEGPRRDLPRNCMVGRADDFRHRGHHQSFALRQLGGSRSRDPPHRHGAFIRTPSVSGHVLVAGDPIRDRYPDHRPGFGRSLAIRSRPGLVQPADSFSRG